MAHVSLSFEDVEDVELINRLTSELMMVDGVESADVGRHGADVEGRINRATLIKAVERLGVTVR